MSSALSEHEVSAAYSKFGHLVLLRCRRILRDDSAAEDAMQDAFLRLWRYGKAFREAESKVSWLYRVAERCCFDQAAKRNKLAEVPVGDEIDWPVLTKTDSSVEDWNLVARFLGRFEERLQRVAVMYYVDEMTQEEIADALGWSRQTVIKKLDHIQTRAVQLKKSLTGMEK